jgi:N-acetylmuramoyl-L-alanine amidase
MNPDFMLSIHCNGFSNSSVKGIEIYPKHNGSPLVKSISKSLSNNILSKVIEVSRLEGYDYVNRGVKEANLHMILGIECPGALLECGFITNYNEFLWLNSPRGQLAIAYAISQAFVNYIER